MVILSGSSNPVLAEAIARRLKVPVLRRTLDKFPNGEVRVYLEESVVGKIVIIVQSLQDQVHLHLMELMLLADAARRGSARIVMAVVPWLAYSKQDKVFRTGEPLSVRVVARMISTSAIKRLYLMELHNPGVQGFFDLPTYHLTFKEVFARKIKPKVNKKTVVIAPDFGGIKRSRELADLLRVEVGYLDKTRSLKTGKVRFHRCSIPIKGRQVVMFDDMIATGSTAIEAAGYLKSQGAETITYCATHGLFTSGWRPFAGVGFDRILVSDSVALPAGISSIVEVISSAPVITDALKEMVYRV